MAASIMAHHHDAKPRSTQKLCAQRRSAALAQLHKDVETAKIFPAHGPNLNVHRQLVKVFQSNHTREPWERTVIEPETKTKHVDDYLAAAPDFTYYTNDMPEWKLVPHSPVDECLKAIITQIREWKPRPSPLCRVHVPAAASCGTSCKHEESTRLKQAPAATGRNEVSILLSCFVEKLSAAAIDALLIDGQKRAPLFLALFFVFYLVPHSGDVNTPSRPY